MDFKTNDFYLYFSQMSVHDNKSFTIISNSKKSKEPIRGSWCCNIRYSALLVYLNISTSK